MLWKAVLRGVAQAKVTRYAAPLDTAITAFGSRPAIRDWYGTSVAAARSLEDRQPQQAVMQGAERTQRTCHGREANDAALIRPFI